MLVDLILQGRNLEQQLLDVVEIEEVEAADINLNDVTVLQTCDEQIGETPPLIFCSQTNGISIPNTSTSENQANVSTKANSPDNIFDAEDAADDPDYVPDEEEEEDENNQVEVHRHQSTASSSTSVSRNRKRIANKSEWSDVKNKRLRELGKEYTGWSRPKNSQAKRGVPRTKRKLGPRCTSSACKKSKVRNCDTFSEDQRQQLFDNFWLMSWDQKKVYIGSHVKVIPVKRTTAVINEISRRQATKQFLLTSSDGRSVQVCQKFFLGTFGLKETMMRKWLVQTSDGTFEPKQTLCERRQVSKVSCGPRNVQRQDLEIFLDSLPKLPSHYCRQSSTKLYVEPVFGNTIASIYREYHNWCEKFSQHGPLSLCTFTQVVKQKNIAFQQPKKDQCDQCCSHKTGNLSDGDYNAHILRKTKAREEKGRDKLRGESGECTVLTQDLQAVKVCPMLNASSLYYKTKLCCHNFTVFNLTTHQARCYWFTEVDADLNASTFASCIIDYLEDMYQEGKPVIIWSDSCSYQNKNSTLANALLSFSVQKKVTVEQKFLEKGHTQMEADSVHATIEKYIKNKPIYVPNDYCEATARARQHPFPYEVKRIFFDFVKNFDDNLIYSSIRPGRKAGDPTVNDIKAIKYTPEGDIFVKLNFDSEYICLPVRKKKELSEIYKLEQFRQRHFAVLSISNQKWTHLQQLKNVIPKDYHPFYDTLPHTNN